MPCAFLNSIWVLFLSKIFLDICRQILKIVKFIYFISLPHYLFLTYVTRFWKLKIFIFHLTAFYWYMSPDFKNGKILFFISLPSIHICDQILKIEKFIYFISLSHYLLLTYVTRFWKFENLFILLLPHYLQLTYVARFWILKNFILHLTASLPSIRICDQILKFVKFYFSSHCLTTFFW